MLVRVRVEAEAEAKEGAEVAGIPILEFFHLLRIGKVQRKHANTEMSYKDMCKKVDPE
jgi:hypothetical protein